MQNASVDRPQADGTTQVGAQSSIVSRNRDRCCTSAGRGCVPEDSQYTGVLLHLVGDTDNSTDGKFSTGLSFRISFMHSIQMGSATDRSGLLVPQRLLFVETDPDRGGNGGGESDEPCVGEVVGGPGFAAERAAPATWRLLRYRSARHFEADRASVRAISGFRTWCILRHALFLFDVIVIFDLPDEVWFGLHSEIWKHRKGRRHFQRSSFARANRQRQIGFQRDL